MYFKVYYLYSLKRKKKYMSSVEGMLLKSLAGSQRNSKVH